MSLKDSEKNLVRMRGSVHGQVEGLFHAVSGIGMSRHLLKSNNEEDIGIHSDNTRAVYLRIWHKLVTYAQEKYGITQILDIDPFLMVEWLELQTCRDLAPATVRTYAAALTKFLLALEHYRTRAEGRRRTK